MKLINFQHTMPDMETDVFMDLTEAISYCASTESLLSIESVSELWSQIVMSEALKQESMAEMDTFIAEYYNSMDNSIKVLIVQAAKQMGITIVMEEYNLIINSPQVGIIESLTVNVGDDQYECSYLSEWIREGGLR